MTKLQTLKDQYQRSENRYQEFMAKAKKEEEKMKDLSTQIKLAEYDAFSDLLAERGLTVADYLEEEDNKEKKGGNDHVPSNQSDAEHDNDL